MKVRLGFIIVVTVFSCKTDVEPLNAKNKFEATVTFNSGFNSGEIRKFSATGSNVQFGCSSFFGGGSYVVADQSPSAINLGYIGGYRCITGPGTYDFSCDYYLNKFLQFAPTYMSWSSNHRGSITYTIFDGKYAEGYFEAVCTAKPDSVSVKGTFSGYLK
jgi:hypothetical protein